VLVEEEQLVDGGRGAPEGIEGRDDLGGVEEVGAALDPFLEGGDLGLDLVGLFADGAGVLLGELLLELALEVERELQADEGENQAGQDDGDDRDDHDPPHREVMEAFEGHGLRFGGWRRHPRVLEQQTGCVTRAA
jgi:hypothetical protein